MRFHVSPFSRFAVRSFPLEWQCACPPNGSKEDIIKCIVHIVERVKDDRTRYRIYIDIILFDTLNQLFGGKRGAGNLIFEVYERLEEYLSDSLQRSKSIYRLKSNDLAKLKEAYSYSIKVYFDGGHAIKSKHMIWTS